MLHLPLKKEWYEMIERGEKREEYREIKPYWIKRLVPCTTECANGHWSENHNQCVYTCPAVHGHMNGYFRGQRISPYTRVCFRYGYTKRIMKFDIVDVSIGYGDSKKGAPKDRKVFIIKFQPSDQ
jgi:hypothetical protein